MKVCIRPRIQCLENNFHKLCGKDQGKGCYFFMVNNNACFVRARKLAKENGVIIRYDSKTADYFAVKTMETI